MHSEDARSVFHNIVVVNDGSADGTAEEAVAGGAVVVRHILNMGQAAALQTGIEYALRAGATHIALFPPHPCVGLLAFNRLAAVDCQTIWKFESCMHFRH